MLSDFPSAQPKTSKRSKRTTDQSIRRRVAKWDCKANIVWRNGRWSTPGYWNILRSGACSSLKMCLLTLPGYLCKVTWASVPEFSTCMYSIYRVEIFYQFLQCTVPDKFEHDPNFLPFILFYTLKLKHNYNELSRGVS